MAYPALGGTGGKPSKGGGGGIPTFPGGDYTHVVCCGSGADQKCITVSCPEGGASISYSCESGSPTSIECKDRWGNDLAPSDKAG